MELLLGSAVVVLVTNLLRWVFKKFGAKVGQAIVLLIAFALSGIAAYIYQVVPASFWQNLLALFGVQMAIWEVIYKRVLKPAFDALTE